ncbi:hypothetical protein Y696_00345 [Mesotoga sp. H07pep.5.4]|nr:hypothetical protein Y696_00345 [Mesotoga sp. H07pep.5.4]
MDAGLAKIMPGRKARFAGKDPQSQSADAGQSPSVASQAAPGQSRLRRRKFRLRRADKIPYRNTTG